MRKKCSLIVKCLLILFIFGSCAFKDSDQNPAQTEYGVFLSVTENIDKLDAYKTVVIDAQYFSAQDIENFKKKGHIVYSYINVGSLESFRDYYDTYKDLKLGDYEHWDEEIWIDVSDERWQRFILDELACELSDKGIDGFFVDNCDVYYQYPTEEIFDGVSRIMQGLIGTGKDVIINGGDAFLDAYCNNGGKYDDVITGINQETVFSKIQWNEDRFSEASAEDHEYFCDYVEKYGDMGAKIFLLEYTKDEKLISNIDEYCKNHGYLYYVSDSLELD